MPENFLKAMPENFHDSQLRSFLLLAYRQQATGYLNVELDHHRWQIWLYRGRLAWCTGNRHRLRRLQRAIKLRTESQAREGWNGLVAATKQNLSDPLWEVRCLEQALVEELLAIERAQAIVMQAAIEVFFVVDQPSARFQWIAQPIDPIHPNLPLSSALMGEALTRAYNLQRHWQRLPFNPLWADRGWIYLPGNETAADTSTTMTLAPLLDGKRTFWDIVAKLDPNYANLGGVLKVFQLLWQRKQLAVIELPDLEMSHQAPQASFSLKVACVDDDPKICEKIEKIVIGNGHQFLGCFEPLAALPKVIEAKPDVVFLDVVMPVINGHELCAQLRRVQQLSHTSIVMLTSADGLFDRARAKLSGASSFVSKPVTPDKVLAALKRHQHNQVVAH
ncbi:response regulator [Limnothrix sp. FACHB-881]|uniref:response regulator n=1 Tax=Limnothrix sp. FACHB-881 TaxID=2692819 RepID=UPI001682DBD5|nr:response regulator [Limnothrix sp. FACHB-881]MBD2635470.1 response regulator [Limnothrix sp. FACHB-881]